MSSFCVFCAIIAGRSPAQFLPTLGDFTLAFRPLNPVVAGHVLFVPRGHFPDAAADPVATGHVMAEAAGYARVRGEAFNLITSAGSAATQTVFHLHVHYVPRNEGDDLHLPWTGQQVA